MGQCTATSKRTGERCRRRASKGKTVCRVHGADSPGAPKGNKNAMKSGAYETIVRETLFEDEQAFAESVSLDPVATLKEQIRMLRVKELRLSRRIKQAIQAEKEAGQNDGNGKKKPGTVLLSVSTVQSQNFQGETSKSVTSQSETHAMHYLRLEAAHTMTLDQIRKAMMNLAQMGAGFSGYSGKLSAFCRHVVGAGRRTKRQGE